MVSLTWFTFLAHVDVMVGYAELTRVFGRIGLVSFGGPAAQIALMHRELVDVKGWLSETQFLRALSFCMLLPGPEAMQLATYAGWRLKGVLGGVVAGGLFVLPGACVIAVLALLYAQYGAHPDTTALLLGVKACVLVIVAQALVRLSRKALARRLDLGLALAAFVALYAFDLPFPLIIALAALIGALAQTANDPPEAAPSPTSVRTSPRVLVLWAGLWVAPLPLLWLSGQTLLFDLAAFFAKLAVVTFGGAYAVLAYMAQEVVETRNWLDAAQMVDALGLAETTPGPLILVTQFVGQLAGHSAGGAGFALAAGALTLWMTFVPCFLWIFAFAPHVETLLARPRLQAALAAITAAVVGVILNLSLWFAQHVVFDQVSTIQVGPAALHVPHLDSLNLMVLPPLALAAVLILVWHRGVLPTLATCAALSWGLAQL